MPSRTVDLTRCQCGGAISIERWDNPCASDDLVTLRSRRIACPPWAFEYAIQGLAIVSRYSCVACQREHAILAFDPEDISPRQ